jgi:hypothetical protein
MTGAERMKNMKLTDVGQIIGSRSLTLDGESKVEVLVGLPQKLSETEFEYFCPYQVTGLAFEGVRYAIGPDALKALQYTLERIGVELYTSVEAKTGRLVWNYGVVEGDLGFPVMDNVRDMLPKGLR